MKKVISSVLMLLLVFSLAIPLVGASTGSEKTVLSTETVYLSDGSYYIETIYEEINTNRLMALLSSTRSKSRDYYSSNGSRTYSLTVTGTFNYNGSTATALSATSSYTIYMSGWSCTTHSARTSGASAIASGTFKNGSLTEYPSVTLTCSPSGTFS